MKRAVSYRKYDETVFSWGGCLLFIYNIYLRRMQFVSTVRIFAAAVLAYVKNNILNNKIHRNTESLMLYFYS